MNWSTNLTPNTTTLEAASGTPKRSSSPRDRAIEPEAHRLGVDEHHGGDQRRGDAADGQAHGAHAGERAGDRDDRAQPAVDLVDRHPPPGAEVALQQRGRGRHDAVDDDARGEHADDRGRVRRAHGGAEERSRQDGDDGEDEARERGERRDRRRDLLRRALPAHDRQAHAELVEAEDRQQREQARRRRCRTPPGRGCAPARSRSASVPSRETRVLATLTASARPARAPSVGRLHQAASRTLVPRSRRAGTPAQTSPAGIDRVTTAPMPTTAPLPTTMFSRSSAPEPTYARVLDRHAAGDADARPERDAVPDAVVVREHDRRHHGDVRAERHVGGQDDARRAAPSRRRSSPSAGRPRWGGSSVA